MAAESFTLDRIARRRPKKEKDRREDSHSQRTIRSLNDLLLITASVFPTHARTMRGATVRRWMQNCHDEASTTTLDSPCIRSLTTLPYSQSPSTKARWILNTNLPRSPRRPNTSYMTIHLVKAILVGELHFLQSSRAWNGDLPFLPSRM
jgi:hypothetical protein